MNNYISKEELLSDMSPTAIEGMDEFFEETVNELLNTGLMATGICYIAHKILEKYSEPSKRIINSFQRLETLLADADELLDKLQNGESVE